MAIQEGEGNYVPDQETQKFIDEVEKKGIQDQVALGRVRRGFRRASQILGYGKADRPQASEKYNVPASSTNPTESE